jgi:hypothetical protein
VFRRLFFADGHLFAVDPLVAVGVDAREVGLGGFRLHRCFDFAQRVQVAESEFMSVFFVPTQWSAVLVNTGHGKRHSVLSFQNITWFNVSRLLRFRPVFWVGFDPVLLTPLCGSFLLN